MPGQKYGGGNVGLGTCAVFVQILTQQTTCNVNAMKACVFGNLWLGAQCDVGISLIRQKRGIETRMNHMHRGLARCKKKTHKQHKSNNVTTKNTKVSRIGKPAGSTVVALAGRSKVVKTNQTCSCKNWFPTAGTHTLRCRKMGKIPDKIPEHKTAATPC